MNTSTTDGTAVALRIELPVRALRQILTGLAKRASRKKTLPVLECVRIVHDGSGVAEFQATDGTCWNFARPPRSASGPSGTAVVPMAALRDALKGLPTTAKVGIRSEGQRLVFVHGTETRVLPVHKADDFPEPPAFTGHAEVLPPGVKRALVEALRCASTDETRPMIGGIALDLSDRKSHHIVATDGRHLYSANSFTLPVPRSRILGPSPMLLWEPFVTADAWKLRLALDRKAESGAWEIASGIWRTVAPLIEGPYPNWRQVVPDKDAFHHRIVIPSSECPAIEQKLLRLPIASDGRYQTVILEGDGEKLRLRWRDAESNEIQSAVVREATVTREPFRIAVPRPDLAKAIGYGLGELEVIDERSPLRLSDGKGRQMIIMPMRCAFPEDQVKPGVATPTKPAAAATPPRATTPRLTPPVTPPSRGVTPARSPRRATHAATASKSGAQAATDTETGPSLESAMEELGRVRETLRLATSSLQSAAGLIRKANKEQKSNDRELRTVRSTLRNLTKLRF